MSACLGALIGGVAGYLFLTDDGRRLRERLEPGMDDLLREMRHLRSAAEKARMAAVEGVMTFSELRRSVAPKAETPWSGRPPAAH
ncbi:MAG TPA: YtxH domain-containing protein [Vicinamibacterales bacterium]|nr:YtxH domain-containing protein [Vicinamibacterales bacterium]